MKMMDVWLAMFSNPQKDEFRPELVINYREMEGELDRNPLPKENLTGRHVVGQLWLTNLISSTVGIRTLNIDLGIEGGKYQRYPKTNLLFTGREIGYASGNFRIFGSSIQDTSLILKAGRYKLHGATEDNNFEGAFFGAELALYLFKWFGLQGNYHAYYSDTFFKDHDDFKGNYLDYSAFIEISLLRVFFGQYAYRFTEADIFNTTNMGLMGGLQLNL
jgi:hypothetical protein